MSDSGVLKFLKYTYPVAQYNNALIFSILPIQYSGQGWVKSLKIAGISHTYPEASLSITLRHRLLTQLVTGKVSETDKQSTEQISCVLRYISTPVSSNFNRVK